MRSGDSSASKGKIFLVKKIEGMRVITFERRTFLSVIALLMMMVVISSCANGTSAPTTQAVPTVASSENVVVKTANAIVGQKSESILTDTNGKTLYYFTSDVFHQIACTAGCIDTWPPLLFKGIGTVSADTKLSGDLTTDTTPNGNQVVYNGHYLYTYTGDSAPGDTKGEGIGNKWHVATPNLAQNQSNSQAATGY
jgi:predicted lipoprotein with Yx(FWY)xxD motif